MRNTFDILVLLARPAAGKSEIIAYLKAMNPEERSRKLHIGSLEEVDDFPMLWAWFEEDDILSKLGHPRLHTDAEHTFLHTYLWDVLIERIDLDTQKKWRDEDSQLEKTILVEFSRGSQHGGYERSFQHLSRVFAEHAAILYLDVPFEESLRKNQARFNPDKPDSVLQHALSDEKLTLLYKEIDWEKVRRGKANYIPIQGVKVPYVVLDNQHDLTTHPGKALQDALENKLGILWNNLHHKQDDPTD